MRLGGVEIDGVAFFQDDGLAADVEFHLTLQHEIELLTCM